MPNYISYGGRMVEVENPHLVAERKANLEKVQKELDKAQKEYDELDLNKDGKVDKKDVSIAGKVLATAGKKKRGRKPKVKKEVKE